MLSVRISLIILCSSIASTLCQIDDASSGEGNLALDGTIFTTLDGRIVNGTRATIGQFPHQVSLRRSYSDAHFCGGSIINDEWILTAAHCMFLYGNQILPWSVSIVAAQLKLFPAHKFSQKRAVGAIIVHPLYDDATLTNDIALLKLTKPLDLNDTYIGAVRLQERIPKDGSMCRVSGWGYLSEGRHVVSNNLMYVTVPIVNQQRCRELMINVTIVPPGMFCAGYEEGLRDACQGDSGGGMMCGDSLTGIVSGGEGCARPGFPGLYTDVSHYRNWIHDATMNFNGTMEENHDDYYPLRFLGKKLHRA